MSDAAFPSDDMVVLAFLIDRDTEFLCAEEVASVLRRLGFRISSHKMVGTLGRLCREDSPMIEAHDDEEWRLKFYRVTRFGYCQLENHFPLVRALRSTSSKSMGTP